MNAKAEIEYEAPELTELGTLAALTLAPCKSRHADLVPDHVWYYHCADGSVIVGSA